MKSRIVLLMLCLGIIVSVNGCGFMGKRYLKTHSEKHEINTFGKSKIKLDNVSGNVKISQSNDSGILIINASKQIKVKKKYLDKPFDEIGVKIDSDGSVIEISTEINRSGEDGFFKFNIGRDQKVDYEIVIPANLEIEIENVNGDITANRLNNDISIDLVNGEVELDGYTGRLNCEITNGSFSAEVDSTRGMDVSTINGGVTLNLNNFMNANLRAETVNGRITDENLQFRIEDREKKSLKGKLGTGDSNVDIKIETVNGKIKLIGRNEI
ncbi:MAG: hypothetical protein IPL53_04895 [Ignavibacteria bacterium]|nr:hypothetical protein [Ignavibacteria bacterium]